MTALTDYSTLALTAIDPTAGVVVAVALVAAGLGAAFTVSRRKGRDDSDGPSEGEGGTGTALRERDTAPPGADEGGPSTLEEDVPVVPDTPEAIAPPIEVEPPVEEISLGERFRQRLSRTRNVLGASVADLFGRGITEEAWEGLEEALITADVGVTATMELVEELKRRARDEGATDGDDVLALLKQELRGALETPDRSLARASDEGPTVWLITGVNGTGKAARPIGAAR